MAYFDRFDICAAHAALENDWHVGGWLRERPSNARRMESTDVQLHRIGYRPSPLMNATFDGLENENQRDIYVNAMQAYGIKG